MEGDKPNDNQQIPEINYSLLQNILGVQNTDSGVYQSRFITILQNLSMLIENQRQTKILDQIAMAELDGELQMTDDGLQNTFNGFALIFCIFSTMLFKRWTVRFAYLAFYAHLRIHVAEPLLCEYKLRYVAQQDTQLGQEVRNLDYRYRFYYDKEDRDIQEMTKKCQEYLKIQEIRKNIQRRVL